MSDPALLPTPELQFVDANGVPYAGGTLALYVPGTTTPKASWTDWEGTALNTNPIVLDAAGRCIVWGDGDYRCVLQDAQGNLIFDQNSTTLVSAAMVPVVSAPDLPTARRLLGIDDLLAGYATTAYVDAETARAEAAEAALGTRIDNETTRAEAAEAALQSALDAEIARAKAAEAGLAPSGTEATVRTGSVTTDAGGVAHINFVPPFPNMVGQTSDDLGLQPTYSFFADGTYAYSITLSTWTIPVRLASDSGTAAPAGVVFNWMVTGF
jgi:hypothetical protein